MSYLPRPLFDSLSQFQTETEETPIYLPDTPFQEDFQLGLDFLLQYAGNPHTFDAYRREIERLIQWAHSLEQRSILSLGRQDIENYLHFCLNPPHHWIGLKRVPRFINHEGQRVPHPEWRPFVLTQSKQAHKRGDLPEKNNYQLSQKAIREIFTVLNSFFQYLLLQDKIAHNPIALIRQKNKFIQKRQGASPVMRLSEKEWGICLETAEKMATQDPATHERTRFILVIMYLLYLRISELAASPRWLPQMNHFFQDSEGRWWFKTVGKGNKLREIAVSDELLLALRRYRLSLGLTALPSPNENAPLITKLGSTLPLASTRQIRTLLQTCFDQAEYQLRLEGLEDEANHLATATAHWLRHTGISDDINKRGRPIAHVRDDAGHSSTLITDRYNDIDWLARHQSAKDKGLATLKESNDETT